MFFPAVLTPGFAGFFDLTGGLFGLCYSILGSLLILRGFVLKQPVSLRQITLISLIGLLSVCTELVLLLLDIMPLTFWSLLNLFGDMTFLLFFHSRKKPWAAVYALYIQSTIYFLFMLRMVAHMQMNLLPAFLLFQLLPACLLVGIALVVLVQALREGKEPSCSSSEDAKNSAASAWPANFSEEESAEQIAQWDQQAVREANEENETENSAPLSKQ